MDGDRRPRPDNQGEGGAPINCRRGRALLNHVLPPRDFLIILLSHTTPNKFWASNSGKVMNPLPTSRFLADSRLNLICTQVTDYALSRNVTRATRFVTHSWAPPEVRPAHVDVNVTVKLPQSYGLRWYVGRA